jgi:hypothetical protein
MEKDTSVSEKNVLFENPCHLYHEKKKSYAGTLLQLNLPLITVQPVPVKDVLSFAYQKRFYSKPVDLEHCPF